MGPDVHARSVVPEKEWFPRLHRAVHEIIGTADKLRINILHVGLGFWVHIRVRWQRAAVRDGLFSDSAPTRVRRRIVNACGLAVDYIARAKAFVESRSLGIIK